ncbi:hypothetical protein TMM008_08660 [Pseudomonas sp. 008]|nr:hypothetical protein TMM008_08660 [Pseudomonas sp. 008]
MLQGKCRNSRISNDLYMARWVDYEEWNCIRYKYAAWSRDGVIPTDEIRA